MENEDLNAAITKLVDQLRRDKKESGLHDDDFLLACRVAFRIFSGELNANEDT